MKRVILTHVLAALLVCSYQLSADNFHLNADALLTLDCPPNVIVPCDEDLSDLDEFGIAFVHGYGDPYPAPNPHVAYHLNECGVGHIIRTWMVKDYYNVWHSCTQVITVQGGAFGLSNITWPADYTTDECGASLHPNNLPPGFDKPVFDEVECGKPLSSFHDWVFDFGGGCKKILRTWTVIDCCVFDPNSYYPKGIWEHTQVIMVKSEEGPEIVCPEDITVSTTNDECDGADVQLDKATATSVCGDPANVMNDSPFAIKRDGDASGFYPLGTTVVTFTADDGCSEKSSCTTKVTVKDMKQPTPVCYHGLSSTLSQMSDGYYLDLQAHWFNLKSFDNCTADEDLKLEVSPQRVDCDDLGRVEVILTVTDESGNSDFCITYITITDNFGLCPPEDSLIVGGTVYDIRYDYIDHVSVILKDENDIVLSTAPVINGSYELVNKGDADKLYVEAVSSDDPLNGVTTFDLLLMSKYILGEWEPENTMDLLAADVNFDGEINSKDLLIVRDVILGNRSNFPSGSSWRFYNSEYEVENRVQPYLDEIPVKIELIDPDKIIENVNFSGIKLGDLNSSARSNSLSDDQASERSITEFKVDAEIENGLHILRLGLNDLKMHTYGFQFGMHLGSENELLQVNSDIFSQDEIRWNVMPDGELRVSVFSNQKLLVSEGQHILELIFTKEMVSYESKSFESEFYSDLSDVKKLKLIPADQINPSSANIYDLISVFPNPFSNELSIEINESLPISSPVTLKLTDISGRIIQNMTIGEENLDGATWTLDAESVVSGIYLLHIETEANRIVKRLIRK